MKQMSVPVPGAYAQLDSHPPKPTDGLEADKAYVYGHQASFQYLASLVKEIPVGIVVDDEGFAWAAPLWVFQKTITDEHELKIHARYRPTETAYEKLSTFVSNQSKGQVTVLLEHPIAPGEGDNGDRIRVFNL